MIKKGYKLRFCNTRNDTDRCISPDGYPSRLETQTAMEKSNYTLLLPGDTAGSDRWSQAMVAGKQLTIYDHLNHFTPFESFQTIKLVNKPLIADLV